MITTHKSKWIQLFWPPTVADCHVLVHVQNLGTSTSLLSSVEFKVPYSLLNMNTWCYPYRTIPYGHACSYLERTQKIHWKGTLYTPFIYFFNTWVQSRRAGFGVSGSVTPIPAFLYLLYSSQSTTTNSQSCHTTSGRQRITFNPPLPNIKPRYFALGDPFPKGKMTTAL
jgi:hypothetical protein